MKKIYKLELENEVEQSIEKVIFYDLSELDDILNKLKIKYKNSLIPIRYAVYECLEAPKGFEKFAYEEIDGKFYFTEIKLQGTLISGVEGFEVVKDKEKLCETIDEVFEFSTLDIVFGTEDVNFNAEKIEELEQKIQEIKRKIPIYKEEIQRIKDVVQERNKLEKAIENS